MVFLTRVLPKNTVPLLAGIHKMLRMPSIRSYNPYETSDRPLPRWFRWVLVGLSVGALGMLSALWWVMR